MRLQWVVFHRFELNLIGANLQVMDEHGPTHSVAFITPPHSGRRGVGNQEEAEGMRTRAKVVALAVGVAVIIGAALICIPVMSGCGASALCSEPNQKVSISLFYLGFGVESAYGGAYGSATYYWCTSQGCSYL